MGAWFGNLQVHVGILDPFEAREQLAEVIGDLMAHDGFEPVDPTSPSDRAFTIGPIGSVPWLSLFPREGDRRGRDMLRSVAEAVSVGLDRPVVSIACFDSDEVAMRLHLGGELIDEVALCVEGYAAGSEHLEYAFPGLYSDYRGDPRRWLGVLPSDVTPDRLGAAFAGRPEAFVQDQLAKVVDALGMDL